MPPRLPSATLSDHPFARVEEEFLAEKDGQALHMNLEVSRVEYEELIRPLLDRTMDCVRKALDDAGLTAIQIDKVVLVGGSTRTPLVSTLLEERLRQAPHQEVNPDLCVAMGAAIQGGLIAGVDVRAVLVDITPHSLGIKCLDDMGGPMLGFPFRFAPIIHRNTPLPASRSEVFHTYRDGQTEVEIDVYQGEDDDVRRNHRIGRFLVQGLANAPAGNAIIVQLNLNLDGVLKVTARERATGLQKEVTIDKALTHSEDAETDASRDRLEDLWGQNDLAAVQNALGEGDGDGEDVDGAGALDEIPSLAPGPREGQRETVQARALLEKADRLLTVTQPEDKVEVERLMARVRVALTDRKWEDLSAAANELADTLFYLEDA